jgi:DNA-binding GntR family transcriptional regulator
MASEIPAKVPGPPTGVLSRVPLRDQAVEVLRDMVVSGTLGSGDRINEAEVAAQLGISRGPLREAIQRLGAEGFIEFRQNRGAFVRTITLVDVRHMYELREAIEVKAAALAALRAGDEGVRQLEELVRAADDLLSSDAAGSYPVEFDLHQLVLDLSGNPYLQAAGIDLQNQVRLARIKSGRSPARARLALTEHRLIISAIAARDPDKASVAMADHLRKSFDHSLKYSVDHLRTAPA